MMETALFVKIFAVGAAIGAAAIVAGKVARKVKSKSENQNSADFTTAHVETLYIKDVLSFFDNIEQNGYTGLVVYISPQDSNNSIVNHCRKEFQKKFGNKEGIALLLLNNDKKIVKGKLFSFDQMDGELNEMFEEWNIFKTDYSIIKK